LEVFFLLEVGAMIGENRQLVTNEPVEFEKSPVEVQDCRKITGHFLEEFIE
jgi:hypothetical protein